MLTDLGGVHYLLSNLVAIGLTFGIRYLVADNWIWAGRDRRDQVPIDGAYQYDVHGIVRITSTVHLPELAAFNVAHAGSSRTSSSVAGPSAAARGSTSRRSRGPTASSATASTSERWRPRST